MRQMFVLDLDRGGAQANFGSVFSKPIP